MASAEYDLETAQKMLEAGRYVYVVFMCHLAVEKTLKALVCEVTGAPHPRTHNLLRLSSLAEIEAEPSDAEFMDLLVHACVAARYPDLAQMAVRYSEQAARDSLERTGALIVWLRADPRLSS